MVERQMYKSLSKDLPLELNDEEIPIFFQILSKEEIVNQELVSVTFWRQLKDKYQFNKICSMLVLPEFISLSEPVDTNGAIFQY